MAKDTLNVLQCAPDPLVAEFADKIAVFSPMRILDAGSSFGRNALYLASCGHEVHALDANLQDLREARQGANGNLHVIAGDIRNLPLRPVFDAVTMNYVLHELPAADRYATVEGLQAVTRPMGLHAISGYVGDGGNALRSNQLYEWYAKSGWYIASYDEQVLPTQTHAGKTLLSSWARIIAVKR